MPTIEFMETHLGAAKTIEADGGEELVDLCDEYLAPVPFSCRSATCGTCHIVIEEGEHLLEEPGPEEAELLELLSGPPGSRLACQAVVRVGQGVVRLRPVL